MICKNFAKHYERTNFHNRQLMQLYRVLISLLLNSTGLRTIISPKILPEIQKITYFWIQCCRNVKAPGVDSAFLSEHVRTSLNEVNILPPLYWVVILSQIGLFIPFLVRHCHNICRYFSRIGPWKSSDPSSFILNVSRIPTTSVFSVMESWWNHLHSKEIMLLRSSYCDQIGTPKGEGVIVKRAHFLSY